MTGLVISSFANISVCLSLQAEETRQTNEQVAIDRVSILEATIVRIMKGRKTVTLQLLIDAVITDVNKRFPPDVKEIKKRVESLIEREVSARTLPWSFRISAGALRFMLLFRAGPS